MGHKSNLNLKAKTSKFDWLVHLSFSWEHVVSKLIAMSPVWSHSLPRPSLHRHSLRPGKVLARVIDWLFRVETSRPQYFMIPVLFFIFDFLWDRCRIENTFQEQPLMILSCGKGYRTEKQSAKTTLAVQENLSNCVKCFMSLPPGPI